MDALRKRLAALLAVLFIPIAALSLLGVNLERKAFESGTYKQALADGNFYENLPASLAQAIVGSEEMQSLPVVIRSLGAEQWEEFLRELLPAEMLQRMGDQAFDSLFAYLAGEADEAVVDVTPLKAQMSGGAGAQAVVSLMQNLPPCTLEELARITIGLLNEQEVAFCNPPAEWEGVVRPLIQEQVQTATLGLPDQLVIASYDPAAGLPDPRQRILVARAVLRFLPILPLLLLFVWTVLAVRSLRGWLGWWGLPFVGTGLAANIMAWTGAPLASHLLLNLLAARAPAVLPPALLNDLAALVSAVMAQALRPLSLQAWILLLLGLGMSTLALALSLFQGESRRK
jgi:hypothetical protein